MRSIIERIESNKAFLKRSRFDSRHWFVVVDARVCESPELKSLISTSLKYCGSHSSAKKYPAYEENLQRNCTRQKQGASSLEQERNLADATPEDLIDNAFGRLQASLREELLEYLRAMDVYQFEEVVADLLKKMGCGDLGDVWVTKKSNDEGIVGVLG